MSHSQRFRSPIALRTETARGDMPPRPAALTRSRRRPDAVTLDLNLLDGLAVPVAELLTSMGVPFVVVSAYGAGSVDHPVPKQAPRLSKPFGRAP